VVAGGYPITASAAADGNYTITYAAGTLTINKVNALISVTPYTVTYDANAHTSTASATGVNGENLSSLLTLSGTTHTDAGTYNLDAWGFSGNSNYNSANGTVNNKINKAISTTTVTITGAPFTYTGSAITPASVTVTGAGMTTLTPAPVYTANTNAGTANASYTYPGDANHEGSSDNEDFTIGKANALISVTPYDIPYDGIAHTATGSAKGVKGEALQGLSVIGTHTDAGTYSDSWSFTDVTGNYNDIASTTITDKISKKTITVTPTSGLWKYYSCTDPELTYAYAPALIGSDAFGGTLVRALGEDVGTYAITSNLTLSSNYNLVFTTGKTFEIKAQPAGPISSSALYTGSTFFWTTGATSSTATLTLATTLKGLECGKGDIKTARVSFVIRDAVGSGYTIIPGAQNLPVNYLDPNNKNEATAAVAVQYNIGSGTSTIINLGVIVSGNYSANSVAFDQPVTISKPVKEGQLSGGAVLDKASATTGFIGGPSASSTVTFSDIKYNKAKTGIQGDIQIKITTDRNEYGVPDTRSHVYRIKTNAITVLTNTTGTSTGTGTNGTTAASFGSKANIVELLTDKTPLAERSLYVNGERPIEGNCTMIMDIKDLATACPNTSDLIKVAIHRNKGGVWYATNWSGSQADYQNISNGNVVYGTGGVSTSTSTVARMSTNLQDQTTTLSQFDVKASPNPTTSQFTLKLESDDLNQPMTIRVFNVLGKLMEVRNNLKAGQTLQIGSVYRHGVYMVEVWQGKKRKVLKLVKQPD
jgi:hypothetical protein